MCKADRIMGQSHLHEELREAFPELSPFIMVLSARTQLPSAQVLRYGLVFSCALYDC